MTDCNYKGCTTPAKYELTYFGNDQHGRTLPEPTRTQESCEGHLVDLVLEQYIGMPTMITDVNGSREHKDLLKTVTTEAKKRLKTNKP